MSLVAVAMPAKLLMLAQRADCSMMTVADVPRENLSCKSYHCILQEWLI